jgi:hypothetical protein
MPRTKDEQMTTRPKSRRAPAAKTATPEFVYLPYDGTTANIPKLIARLRFLEADCRYHAAICDPDPSVRHVALDIRHREERDEIMQRLAKTVPDDFDDAMTLLKFATARAESATLLTGMAKSIIAMLKNAAKGTFTAYVKVRVDFALRRFDERRDQFAGDDA